MVNNTLICEHDFNLYMFNFVRTFDYSDTIYTCHLYFYFQLTLVFSRVITSTYQRSFQIYLRHLKTDNSTVL